MSDVIVLPPSGAPLLCYYVTKSTQKTKKKNKNGGIKVCAGLLFKQKEVQTLMYYLTGNILTVI